MKRESKLLDGGRFAKMLNDEDLYEEEQNNYPENKKSKSLNTSHVSGKNMIDVIEELEEEAENVDSDESFTKEFYQTMHQDVLMRGMS